MVKKTNTNRQTTVHIKQNRNPKTTEQHEPLKKCG